MQEIPLKAPVGKSCLVWGDRGGERQRRVVSRFPDPRISPSVSLRVLSPTYSTGSRVVSQTRPKVTARWEAPVKYHKRTGFGGLIGEKLVILSS